MITYNTGLLKKHGFNFVPCVSKRTQAQVNEVEKVLLNTRGGFVLFLQEVWTRKGFKAYERMASDNGFSFYPKNYDEIKNNGQMNITNLSVVNSGFYKFKNDKRVDRGIRSIVTNLNEETIEFLNIHISYSDSKMINPEQKKQLQEIMKELDQKTGNIILGGDFNSGPNLVYKEINYDHQKDLWEELILNPLADKGFNLNSTINENTWVSDINPIIYNPTLTIKLYNLFVNFEWGWEKFNAVIDHLFSNFIQISDSKILLNTPVEFKRRCRRLKSTKKSSYLSDHFANSISF